MRSRKEGLFDDILILGSSKDAVSHSLYLYPEQHPEEDEKAVSNLQLNQEYV